MIHITSRSARTSYGETLARSSQFSNLLNFQMPHRQHPECMTTIYYLDQSKGTNILAARVE